MREMPADVSVPCASPYLLRRRAVVGGGLVLVSLRSAASPRLGLPGDGQLGFVVRRNGTAIGTHRLTFSRTETALTVHIEANFRIGFGPITFYAYRHTGVEQWQNGRFISLETRTNDNGSIFYMRARRTPPGVAIEVNSQPLPLAPPDALPLTHWAMAAMSAPLFNPETGKILGEMARPQGAGTVALADGKVLAATHYALAGEAPIEDWYDSESVWVALDAVGRDGSNITYRRA